MAWIIALLIVFGIGKIICKGIDAIQSRKIILEAEANRKAAEAESQAKIAEIEHKYENIHRNQDSYVREMLISHYLAIDLLGPKYKRAANELPNWRSALAKLRMLKDGYIPFLAEPSMRDNFRPDAFDPFILKDVDLRKTFLDGVMPDADHLNSAANDRFRSFVHDVRWPVYGDATGYAEIFNEDLKELTNFNWKKLRREDLR